MYGADIPLSYGLVDVKLDPRHVNTLECVWDAGRDSAIFIRVHCISTEFTARKHGGEKGVPFRLQIETYTDSFSLLHCASTQIKVFKVLHVRLRLPPAAFLGVFILFC